jgi:hypothetical protein
MDRKSEQDIGGVSTNKGIELVVIQLMLSVGAVHQLKLPRLIQHRRIPRRRQVLKEGERSHENKADMCHR